MKRAAVVIGVDKVQGLTPLTGAAEGAKKFADWATGQGIQTALITDKGKPVTVAEIKAAVAQVVNKGTFGQLLVYFAGHGYLNAPNYEVWLLSGAPADADEAVNVMNSIDLARKSGIPHVVFISDACRTAAKNEEGRVVRGATIFPNQPGRKPRPEVDLYYATLPGDAAYEVPREYQGVFTRYLLSGLMAKVNGVTEEFAVDGKPRRVVPSWRLKPYLEEEFPIEAANAVPGLNQDPEVRVESHQPKYMADVGDATPAAGPAPVSPSPAPPPGVDHRARIFDLTVMSPHELPPKTVPPRLSGKKAAAWTNVERAAERIQGAVGRRTFETRTGFTIIGAEVKLALSAAGKCSAFPDKDDPAKWHVSVDAGYPSEPGGTALICLANERGLPLAVLPGYVGTVLVEHGRVVNVSYTPAADTGLHQIWEYEKHDVERRRAFIAAATREGLFKVTQQDAKGLANRLRQQKKLDPTLGLYSAYAYFQAGLEEEVHSVYEFMREDNKTLLFDVALLAGELERRPMKVLEAAGDAGGPRTPEGAAPTELFAGGITVAPLCPVLTQGWGLLDGDKTVENDVLRKLEKHLIPGLWTTLDASGQDYLRTLIEDRAIR